MTLLSRLIPCLLLSGHGLYKTIRFDHPTYVGDPINAVRIFNEREVDEIAILDISATRNAKPPDFRFIEDIVSEAFMPIAYGGGISCIDEVGSLFTIGVEKAIISTRAAGDPNFIRQAADLYGSQSIVACIDVKKTAFRSYQVLSHCGRRPTCWDPVDLARRFEQEGAGEILVNAIDRDGTMSGYDIPLLAEIAASVHVPVIASGGAGSLEHVKQVITAGGASAAAAGSIFVFHGKHRAVLISYPDARQRADLCSDEQKC